MVKSVLFRRLDTRGGSAQFLSKRPDTLKLAKPLIHRQLQVLAQERAVHVLLVRLDNGVAIVRRGERVGRWGRIVHGRSSGVRVDTFLLYVMVGADRARAS